MGGSRDRTLPLWPASGAVTCDRPIPTARKDTRLVRHHNGGGLSYCHPGMYGIFLIIEAVRQQRGECGERRQSDTDAALVNGNGGVPSSRTTALLGTAEALG
ncbi:hypothetical protein ACFCWG_26445 [Streptomyces sp. NPDC056390]|uniref:thiolase C-terminal domain-containing protein n=1 Tax=Streptomyces sp. NPDC056390 TaxID=3345806 RepID=UPI0035DCCD80